MAEIGLIASITGVTAIGVALSQTIYRAIQGTANAPDAVQGLDKEINIICEMLQALTVSLNDGAAVPPGTKDIIEQLGEDLERLSAIVERYLPVRRNAAKQVWSQFKWMLHTGDVKHLRDRIGRFRELLLQSVSITNGTELAAIRRGLNAEQQSFVEQIDRPYAGPRQSYTFEVRGRQQRSMDHPNDSRELEIDQPYDRPRPSYTFEVRGHQQRSRDLPSDSIELEIPRPARSELWNNESIGKLERSPNQLVVSERDVGESSSEKPGTPPKRWYTRVLADRLPL